LAINLARHIDPHSYEVKVGVLERRGEYLQQIESGLLIAAPEVPVLCLMRLRFESPLRGLGSVWQIGRLVDWFRPDIVISFMLDISLPTYLALRKTSFRPRHWFVHEGNHTSLVLRQAVPSRWLRRGLRWLISKTYSACDGLVATSHGVKSDLLAAFAVREESVTVIGNPTDIEAIHRVSTLPPVFDLPEPYIVAVGRLVRQKGFDILIRAFSELADRKIHLVILGEGAERINLEQLARDAGVSDRVHLPGFVTNPWAIMKRARIFCLSSRMEGFGNVVPEAMALGLPVIVTDCDFGPREIVRDGVDGLVVARNSAVALRDGIAILLMDSGRATQLAEAARRRAMDFSAATIARQYENLFIRGRATVSAQPDSANRKG
jgi:N-acetylgalactosamine-N,N'-diacetylbacillosaminyl-diphospho-undecaprenol 4-alpha-N-acetylgalactosaminyltransferase